MIPFTWDNFVAFIESTIEEEGNWVESGYENEVSVDGVFKRDAFTAFITKKEQI